MKFKKLMSIMTAGVMALSLVACSSSSDDSDTSKVYKIGTDQTYEPFEMEVDGELCGIDVDLVNTIMKNEGYEVEWEVLGFDAAVTALESGEVDAVMAGMTITDERAEKYDFSDPYYDTGTAIAVAKDSDMASKEDIAGKNMVAKSGTKSYEYAMELSEQYDFNLSVVDQTTVMYEMVKSGEADGCFEDIPVVGYKIATGQVDFKIIDENPNGQYGFAVLKGENADLLKAFNDGLADLKESGEYDEICNKYVAS